VSISPTDIGTITGNKMGGVASFINRNQLSVIVISLISVASVGVVDGLTGYEISLSFFYLIPISFATWRLGRRYGICYSLLSVITWFVADDVVYPHPYSHAFIPYWNSAIRVSVFIAFSLVLNALHKAFKREKELARRDPCTGIANSRAFAEIARSEIDRSRRYSRIFSVAYLDCDNFKAVNDRFGHQAGDNLLRLVAKTAEETIRSTDTVARLGGDEFGILFPETDFISSQDIIRKLRARFADITRQKEWPVTFSFGVVSFVTPPDSVDEMIRIADECMYAVKNNGKNSVRHIVFNRGKISQENSREEIPLIQR